jgi:beta-lactamase regulating signal transducer with metallopeptidase domain
MNLESCLVTALRVAVLLALALAAMPLLRRAPAATRRLVLALALGGALILPAVSALAPAWRVAPPSAVAALREPFAEPLVEGGPALAAVRGAPAATPRAAATTASLRVDPAAALAAVWAIGAILVAARLAAGLVAARAMVRRASPAPSWARAVAQVERATGLRAQVRMTDDLDAPAVTGVVAPVVLVPRASQAWTEARKVAVLHHEIAHVRQRDCLTQILAQLACALHWPNPLAWLAARRLRLERELSADDAVITAGTRATSYAEDLLVIAGARPAPAGALGMAERSQLAARVAAIVSPGRARLPLAPLPAAIVVAGAAAVLFVVACAAPGAPAPAAPAAALPVPTVPAAASTIDRRLQQLADEEIDRTVAEWQPAAAVIVVLDPATGEILANAGRAHGAPADVAVQRAYVTGSTLKAVTLAAALEEGVVTPADRFDCENGARAYGALTLHDSGANGVLTLPEMLAVSTNVGFSKVFDRLGGDRLVRWMRRFHFGAAPALEGAAAGEVPAHVEDGSFAGALVAIGEGPMTATPLQMAAAYATFANDGAYLAPTLTRRGRTPGEPLIKPGTARAVVAMLEEVVNGEHATGKLARLAGVRVAGKTGTADWLPDGSKGVYASFVGIVPADHPRFVILVGVESPRGGEAGGTVAAPAFARLASHALGG